MPHIAIFGFFLTKLLLFNYSNDSTVILDLLETATHESGVQFYLLGLHMQYA